MCARPVPCLLWCAPSSERGAVQHRGSKIGDGVSVHGRKSSMVAEAAWHCLHIVNISPHIRDYISWCVHVHIMYISSLYEKVHIGAYQVDGGGWVVSVTYLAVSHLTARGGSFG